MLSSNCRFGFFTLSSKHSTDGSTLAFKQLVLLQFRLTCLKRKFPIDVCAEDFVLI